ncbi:MAG: DNA repair protein RecN [Alphaproteobacteria bacterium]
MLTNLRIQNIVLIDQLSLEFQQGLCTLTGETGAGKSILLDSLGLALGGRMETRMLRAGAEQASVAATFEIDAKHPVHGLLRESEIESDDTLILRRTVSADGRSKAFINDQPVSIALLRQAGESLVEIHGQFETQGLLDIQTHRVLLDQYAGIEGRLAKMWHGWKNAERTLEELKSQATLSRQQEEYLRQSVEDLDALEPKPGEETSLSALKERLMHREKIMEGLNAAYAVLNGEDDPVRKAAGMLERIAPRMGESGGAVLSALDRASVEIQEAVSIIQGLSADLQDSEHHLETIDERLFALRAQARKHNCTVDDLAEIREKLAAQLNLIERGDEALAEYIARVKKLRSVFEADAKKVSALRMKAAEKLDRLVRKELIPLKLDKAQFVTSVEARPEGEWGPHGMDKVQFLVATNPGSVPGPLGKIASGGEMARFMLALKVVLAEKDHSKTMIFDEVDSGIGGSAADAVGERLAQLAQARQVLVVTHSPQVAARAQHHFIVHKDGKKEVRTNVVYLENKQERREEIARMLSGASITAEARAAADKLLESNAA